MSICLTIVINVMHFALVYLSYPSLHILFSILGKFVYATQILSHYYTVLMNPGIPSNKLYVSDRVTDFIMKNSSENKHILDKYRICKRCNIIVNNEDQVQHCEECGVCLIGIY